MASKSETLKLIIRAKDTASKEFRKLDKALAVTKKRITSLRKTAFNLKTALAGVGAILVAKSFIAAASTAEQYRLRLGVLLGSQKEGNRLFKEMADYAGQVAFEYENVMGSATALAGVMEGGVDEITQWMPLIGDLAAATGLSIEDTTSQIIRMYSAGAASADMFRERGILAMLGFQAGVSYSADETRKKLLEAWESPLSRFRGTAVKLSGTWKGMLSMISDRWFQVRNLVMESGLFDYLKNGFGLILKGISDLKEKGKLDEWATKTADNIIAALEKTLMNVAIFYDAIQPILKGIKDVLGSIWDTYKELPDWVKEVGLVVAILGGKKVALAVAGLAYIYDKVKDLGAGLDLLMSKKITTKEFLFGDIDAVVKKFDKEFKAASETIEKGVEPVQDFWKEFSEADSAAAKVRILTQYMKQLREEAAKQPEAEAPKTPTPTPVPVATDEAKTKSQIARLIASTKTALLILATTYKKGKVTLQQYFDRRRELIEKQYSAELAAMQAAVVAEKDPSKKLALEDQLFAKEENHKRTLLNLTNEQTEAETVLAQKKIEIDQALADLRLRAESEKGGGLLQAGFDEELAEMDGRHAEELQSFKDLLNDKLVAEMGYMDEAAALRDIQSMQRLEKEKLLADQERRIRETQLDNAATVAGGMADAFENLYALTGEKQKEFFYLAKAAALAEAIINTAQGITKALAQGGIMGPILAASVAAAGAIQIATITAQSLAAGGPILGSSPSDTADDIHIMATAGEYVHPVKTVQYYGSQIMEAMRKRMIPREIFAGLTMPSFTIPSPAYAFAAGGPVPTQAAGAIDRGTDINIINVTDPRELDRYLATAAGQNAVLNVLSSRAQAVKRVLR